MKVFVLSILIGICFSPLAEALPLQVGLVCDLFLSRQMPDVPAPMSSALQNLKVVLDPADAVLVSQFENDVLKYSRFKTTRSDRPRMSRYQWWDLSKKTDRYLIFWPTKDGVGSVSAIESTIDLIAQYAFARQKKAFELMAPNPSIASRLDALQWSLLAKMRLANASPDSIAVDERDSILRHSLFVGEALTQLVLPIALRDADGLRVTPQIKKIFAEQGARGVYRSLGAWYGTKYAVRYAIRQITLTQTALLAAFAVAMIPTAIDSAAFIHQQSTVTVAGASDAEVRSTYNEMTMTPQQVISSVRATEKSLPNKEADEVDQLLNQIQVETSSQN